MVTEQQIKLARDKFKEISGITIYTPDEGTLDDFEQSRYDGLVAALEAALSAAEPQPAPSVAVKALKWRNGIRGIVQADTLGGIYQIRDYNGTVWLDMPEAIHMRDPYGSVDHAKAAAQADFETRIRSALSTQVQDVAGTETTTRFHIEWIAGARPPVHPNPMTGRTTFESFERAVQHMKSQADDAQFVSLEERRTTVVCIDRSADMRAALPAAPAKQESVHD